MSNNIAIEFNHVSKMYQLGIVGTGTISNDIKRWWAMSVRGKEDPFLKVGQTNDRATKGTSDFVYALRDIDFKVEQGDVVGIIGKNGAGKSTLLKLLSRITAPTTGTIKAKGRIASLLEVGTGFHGELTGRENIYMNGTIMGMKRHEIDAKLDEIVDFAGVERYLETPVKRYSSGMTVRLGFAVAAFLEPEILVVDEVLAVGDAEFQKKAIGKMQDVSQGQGRTVLFVSHNMDSVLNLCHTGILIENGMTKKIGDVSSIVDEYLSSNKTDKELYQEDSKHPIFINRAMLNKNTVLFDESLELKLKIKKKESHVFDKNTVVSIAIFTNKNVRVCTTEIPISMDEKHDAVEYSIEYPTSLLSPGSYYFRIDIHIPNICLFDGKDACPFTILDSGSEFLKYNGNSNGIIMINPSIV